MRQVSAFGSLGLAIICAGSSFADEAAKYIDIPAQPLSTALSEFGLETGLQVSASGQVVKGKTSQSVSGKMTPSVALTEMLKGTDLEVQSLGSDGSLVTQNIVSQNQGEPLLDLGTLVLRGERVERTVFETSSSVRAYSGEDIEENVQNSDIERVIEDAANVTTIPGSNLGPFIRGQSGTGEGGVLSGQFPRTNVTVDGRILSFGELAFAANQSVWDTEIVEVFRGPQTTSQGANSIAGAINIRTRDPIFDYEFAARAEYGTNDKEIIALMANVPFSESFAARVTFERFREDGYINFRVAPPPNSPVFTVERNTTRVKLLWEPVALPGLSNKLTFSYFEFETPQTQNVIQPFSALISNNLNGFPGAFIGNTKSIIHDFEYAFDNGFAIRNQLQFYRARSTRLTGNPMPLGPELPTTTDDWSNELILELAPEGQPFSGIFGVYYRETVDEPNLLSTTIIDDFKTSLGVFAEGTYRFGNGVDVTAGLRYQQNEQTRFFSSPFLANNIFFDESFDEILPKLAVGYEPNDDLRFSLQISRGFNPGGITGPFTAILFGIAGPNPLVPFQEETNTNVELAMRGRFLDGRLEVNANVFYTDFDDFQFLIPFVVNNFADRLLGNADQVEAFGLEVDALYEPTSRLRLNASLGLLHSEVKKFATNPAVVGNDTPYAPPVTLSAGVEYDLTQKLSVGGQVRYTASYFSDIVNNPLNKIDDLTTVDLRVAYSVSERAEVYGYVNNVFDLVEPTSLFGGGVQGPTTKPREFGIGVRANW